MLSKIDFFMLYLSIMKENGEEKIKKLQKVRTRLKKDSFFP